MKRITVIGMLGIAALAAAAACSPDDAAPADLSGPAGTAGEGTRLSGVFRESVRADGAPAGALAPADVRAFDARVRRGAARDAQSGLVATTRGLALGRRQMRYRDRRGHTFDVTATAAAPGAPVSHLDILVDGRKLADVTLSWQRTGATWVLREREEVFYHEGHELLRRRRAADGVQVGRGALPQRAGALLAAALLPRSAQAAIAYCEQEWVMYAAASLAVVLTAERVYAMPWFPPAWRDYLAAAGVWGVALDALIRCETLNA